MILKKEETPGAKEENHGWVSKQTHWGTTGNSKAVSLTIERVLTRDKQRAAVKIWWSQRALCATGCNPGSIRGHGRARGRIGYAWNGGQLGKGEVGRCLEAILECNWEMVRIWAKKFTEWNRVMERMGTGENRQKRGEPRTDHAASTFNRDLPWKLNPLSACDYINLFFSIVKTVVFSVSTRRNRSRSTF